MDDNLFTRQPPTPVFALISDNWSTLSSIKELKPFYSLERRVIQFKLIASSCSRSHPMVGPESTESVGHKGEQLLVIAQTLTAGQDRPGMDL